jgi:hypothetical protein
LIGYEFRGVRVLPHAGVPLFFYFFYLRFVGLRPAFCVGLTPFSSRYAATDG